MLLALISGWPMASSAQGLDYYSQRIEAVGRKLVVAIRPTLEPRAQKILDDIDFEAPQSWDTNAEARPRLWQPAHRRIQRGVPRRQRLAGGGNDR
jgi:hypothetical protein